MRKADAARYRPIEHRCDHSARLAGEGAISRRCCQVRKGGVEPQSRHHDADTVRPDDAQEMRPCCVECSLLQGFAPLTELAETGGNDDGRSRAALAQLAN